MAHRAHELMDMLRLQVQNIQEERDNLVNERDMALEKVRELETFLRRQEEERQAATPAREQFKPGDEVWLTDDVHSYLLNVARIVAIDEQAAWLKTAKGYTWTWLCNLTLRRRA